MIEALAIRGDRKRGPIEAAHRVVEGFTRKHLAELFCQRGFTSGAEIGVADGRNSLTLCDAIPGLQLLCVDPWAPYKGNQRGGPSEQHARNFQKATERLTPYQATLLRMKSADAAFTVAPRSLDFVFIDGNHAYEYVRTDLQVWSEKVRPGGVVAGHDYFNFAGAGVVKAVNEFTATHGITEWWLTDEREPSFWWVK